MPEGTKSVTLVGFGKHTLDFVRLLAEWDPGLEVHQAEQLQAGEIFDSKGATDLRVWIVWMPGWGACIYFADPMDRRFLLREVPLASGLDEAGRELLAQVIATTARAFIDKQLRSTRAEVLSSLANSQTWALRDVPPTTMQGHLTLAGSVQPQAPKPTWKSYAAVAYATQAANSNTLMHGPAMVLGTAKTVEGWRWMAAVQGQYQFPTSIEASEGTLTLRHWSFGIVSSAERMTASRWTLGSQLGLVVTHTTFGLSKIESPRVIAKPTASHFSPQAQAALRVGYYLGLCRFTVLAGVGVTMVSSHYDVADRPVFTPWIIAPRMALELAWP